LISKRGEQSVVGWLLILAGLAVRFYSPPGSDLVRAFLCLVLISFGTAVLFAKSVREVEQIATRLLYRVLRGRGRGDLLLNNPHALPSLWTPIVTLGVIGLWEFYRAVGAVCNGSARSTILSTDACSSRVSLGQISSLGTRLVAS
jgi:hypothetical protein